MSVAERLRVLSRLVVREHAEHEAKERTVRYRRIMSRRRELRALRQGLAFECPACGGVSYHTRDIAESFCTCCGGPYLPRRCAHDPEGVVAMAEARSFLGDQQRP